MPHHNATTPPNPSAAAQSSVAGLPPSEVPGKNPTEVPGEAPAEAPPAQQVEPSPKSQANTQADMAESLVGLMQGRNEVQTSARVVETADEVLGTLIDTRA